MAERCKPVDTEEEDRIMPENPHIRPVPKSEIGACVPRTAGRMCRDARIWALLFTDLHRAIGELYVTVEHHESVSECEEVILVLDNYTRDFRALADWFKVKWEYDNTPAPQRPLSLAWEIGRADFISRSYNPNDTDTETVYGKPFKRNKLTDKPKPILENGKITNDEAKNGIDVEKNTVKGDKNNVDARTSSNTKERAKNASELPKDAEITVKHNGDRAENTIEAADSDKNTTEMVKNTPESDNTNDTDVVKFKNNAIATAVEAEINKDTATNNAQSDMNTIQDNTNIKEASKTAFVASKITSKAVKNYKAVKKSKGTTENSTAEVKNMTKVSSFITDVTKNPTDAINNIPEATKNIPEPTKNTMEAPKNTSEAPKNIRDASKNIPDATKNTSEPPKNIPGANKNTTEAAKSTIEALNMMECEFLEKQLISNSIKNDNMLNKEIQINIEQMEDTDEPKDEGHKDENDSKKADDSNDRTEVDISPVKSEDGFADISEENSPLNDKEKVKNNIGHENTPSIVSKTTVKQTKTPVKPVIEKNKDMKNKDKNQTKDVGKTKTDAGKIAEDVEKTKVVAKTTMIKAADVNNKTDAQKLELDKKNNTENNKKIENDNDLDTDKKLENTEKKIDTSIDEKKAEKLTVEIKKPAYSQAAAKPKVASAKTESKVITNTPLSRSKTAVEIRSTKVTKILPKRTPTAAKCSYPFNLTTGRTTLFDTPQNKPIKKPVNKIQMLSGDAKIDTKKSTTRRTLSKSIDIKKEKSSAKLERIKDCDEHSSTETIVRIESSESLKTLVPDDYSAANSVEVLNTSADNDGWLTVKSRRLSRESKKQTRNLWANRFHRPSATTSLPTLMLTDNQPGTSNVQNAAANRAKSEQPETSNPQPKQEKSPEPIKEKQEKILRQKSDMTGMKTKKKKKNKSESSDLVKNRLHSSLESVSVDGDNKFDFEKWKELRKRVWSASVEVESCEVEEWSTYDDPEVEHISRSIRENERKISLALDYQTEEDTARLSAEEEALQRQIQHLQESTYLDTDTTDTETETTEEKELPSPSPFQTLTSPNQPLSTVESPPLTVSEDVVEPPTLEARYGAALEGLTPAERVHTLGELAALVARDPGRAQQLHHKLSQGIRRRGSLQDALRRLQAKQARAEQQRLDLQSERTKRIHVLLARVEEVKLAKNQLTEEKRLRMERRLQKAAQNRDQHLKDIVKKAHDEEEKLREIAFIKQLEAENKRHEFLDQCRHHTARLKTMRRDRLRKLEVKAQREAAVVSRRVALEEARQRHVESLLERRRDRDERVRTYRERRDRERGDAQREKAEGVRSRLEALRGEATPRDPEENSPEANPKGRWRRGRKLRNKILALGEEYENGVLNEPNLPVNQVSRFNKIFQQMFSILDTHAHIETTNTDAQPHTHTHKKKKKKNKKHSDVVDVQENKDIVIENKINHNTEDNIKKKMPKDEYCVVNENNNTINELNEKNKAKNLLNDKNNSKNESNDKNNAKNESNENSVANVEGKKSKKKSKSDISISRTESVSSRSSASTKPGNGPMGNVVQMGAIDWSGLDRAVNQLNRRMLDGNHQSKEWQAWIGTNLSRLFQLINPILSTDLPPLAIKSICGLLRVSGAVGGHGAVQTNLLPQLVHLLQYHIEHSGSTDARCAQMTCDIVAIMFDVQLCMSRLQKSPPDSYTTDCVMRGMQVVSYLCSCLSSLEPPQPGALREGIFTVLSVCAELCQQATNESVALSAVSHLVCLASRGAFGAREDVVKGGVRALRMYANLLKLDHRPMQESVSEEWWLEYLMTASRLLDELAPNDSLPNKNSKASETEKSVSEAIVRDVLTILGYMLLDNPSLQSLVCAVWGGASMMSSIPPSWWSRGGDVLLPALYLLTRTPAREVVLHDVLLETLEGYIHSEEAQNIKLVRLIKESNKKIKK